MLTFRGGSRPRGPGFHDCFGAAGLLVGPFLRLIVGDGADGVVFGTKEETPAQVFGLGVDGAADVVGRVGNLSLRNSSGNVVVLSPSEAISRTVGDPSSMNVRGWSSAFRTSSRKGA